MSMEQKNPRTVALKPKTRNTLQAYMFFLPAAAFLILFMIWPMINSAFYSVFKWNLAGNKSFVGLDNYKFMLFQDSSFRRALLNTIIYTIFNMGLTLVLSMVCALLFQKQSRMSVVGRCLVFIPVVVPITVMGMVWKIMYDPQYGFINQVLSMLNITGPSWLYDSNIALLAVTIFNVWKEYGLYTLILIGGLQKIPQDLYEVADVEGANSWQKFWKITLPMLKPIMYFVTTILLINSFKAFDHIWVMTGGGPGNATTTVVTYLYAKVRDNVGLASAASFFLFLIVALFTFIKSVIGKGGEVDE
ncbi:sugar ABC transporter permease [Muricomes intestini]|uniref:carbohydrate ABC transporter permease n=1 Tax=Muricomes intestini TaxID=1796634 RepID=UPI002FE3ADD4